MDVNNQPGAMLVKEGIVSAPVLEQALTRQKTTGKGIGAVLMEMGAITEKAWIEAIAKGFGIKTVQSPASFTFPADLLALVPRDVALERTVFPLKQQNGKLAVAVTDPFDTGTLDRLAKATGLKIVPFLSSRAEIAQAIDTHYAKPSAAARTILVVDDSQAIAGIIQKTLIQEGYRVTVAHDGLEGLKLAVAESPDLIITDTVMPRMDGFGLLRALKGSPATAGIPLILVTAKSGSEDEQRALEAGFLDFIPKPVQPVRVVSRVKRAFELVQSMKRP